MVVSSSRLRLRETTRILLFIAVAHLSANMHAYAVTSEKIDWLNFDPYNFKPAGKLVPNPLLTPKKANSYLKRPSFPSDPKRSNLIYGRGPKSLPTVIYAKAFDVLLIANKYYQAPAAGESKFLTLNGQSVVIYGTSFYTPLKDLRLVANPAQISPFDPNRVFYKENDVWPSVIYGEPGKTISIAGKTFTVPAAGQSVVISVTADANVQQPGQDAPANSNLSSKPSSSNNQIYSAKNSPTKQTRTAAISSINTSANARSGSGSNESRSANSDAGSNTSKGSSSANNKEGSIASSGSLASNVTGKPVTPHSNTTNTELAPNPANKAAATLTAKSTSNTAVNSAPTPMVVKAGGTSASDVAGTAIAANAGSGISTLGSQVGPGTSSSSGAANPGVTTSGSTKSGTPSSSGNSSGSETSSSSASASHAGSTSNSASNTSGAVASGGASNSVEQSSLNYSGNDPLKGSVTDNSGTIFGPTPTRDEVINQTNKMLQGEANIGSRDQILTGSRCLDKPGTWDMLGNITITLVYKGFPIIPNKIEDTDSKGDFQAVKGCYTVGPYTPTGNAIGQVGQYVKFHVSYAIDRHGVPYNWDPNAMQAEVALQPQLISTLYPINNTAPSKQSAPKADFSGF